MYGFQWDYFPGRLHSTKEMIYFLENIENIENVFQNNTNEIINLIFGDVYHSMVIHDTNRYRTRPLRKNISKIIIEISSRKVMYFNDIPLNYYYSMLVNHDRFTPKSLTDEEIEQDIVYIQTLCKRIFHENIEIHIIPHLNLKLKKTTNYIPDRNDLINILENICSKYEIKCHNMGKFIEKVNLNIQESWLEDYMSDSTHYSKDFHKIKQQLIQEIIQNEKN